MVHRHLPSPDSHLDWQPFWAAERRERRQKAFPVRETTGALTRQVIRRRFPTDFHFVSFVGSCEVECRLQVDGNGIAPPMPRALETSGHSVIESVDITAKG